MHDSRIVMVMAQDSANRFEVGTGYLVSQGLVLTARHVVFPGGVPSCSLTVRVPGKPAVVQAAIEWHSGELDSTRDIPLDVALLSVHLDGPVDGLLHWGQYSREEDHNYESAGYPRLSRVQSADAAAIRHVASAGGTITAHGAFYQERLELLPSAPGQTEAWRGLSGAPVFCDACLVGVMVSAPPNATGARLWATPIQALMAHSQFRKLVGDPTLRWVPAVEGLSEPFDPLLVPKSPANWLDARYRVVPFVWEVREQERQFLSEWCNSNEAVSIALFTGPGGSGKTRLLGEWCLEMRLAGWRTGLFEGGVAREPAKLAECAEKLIQCNTNTFVVIDYVERRTPAEVEAVLAALAKGVTSGKRRIALIARDTGAWWDNLKCSEDALARQCAESGRVVSLGETSLDSEGRSLVFERALEAFRVRSGVKPEAGIGMPDLTHRHFGRPLYVQMAALAALRGWSPEGKGLLANVLEHEQRYWTSRLCARRATAAEVRRTKNRVSQCASAVTLLGKVTQDEALSLFGRLDRSSRNDSQLVLDLLSELQPSEPGRLNGLQPDLLGEALVAETLLGLDEASRPTPDRKRSEGKPVDALSEYLRAVVAEAGEEELIHAFTVLGGIELDWSDLIPEQKADASEGGNSASAGGGSFPDAGKEWIRTLLAQNLEQYAVPAFRAAMALGTRSAVSGLGDILAEELQRAGTLELAKALEPLLPERSVPLAGVGVWTYQTLLDDSKPAGGDWAGRLPGLSDAEANERARCMNNLGATLSELGRREEALEAVQRSSEIYRELAKRNPEAFRWAMAMSLSNLGGRLGELGRREEALEATKEAAEILRELAKKSPEAFLPDLAMSLNNQGNRLRELGRREEALAVYHESMMLYRRLADKHEEAFIPFLASSLNNLGMQFGELGRLEDALLLTEEAVKIRRELAKEHPDAFLPDLGTSLSNLGGFLSGAGKQEEALGASRVAVEIFRDLSEKHSQAFLPALAVSLNNLGNRLSDSGRVEEALQASEEAVAILKPFFLNLPPAFVEHMSHFVENYGIDCQALSVEPDQELLGPILAVLAELEKDEEAGDGGGEAVEP